MVYLIVYEEKETLGKSVTLKVCCFMSVLTPLVD
jgi:hypothetical protein